MINSKLSELEFSLDDYVGISSFTQLVNNNNCDPNLIAAIIGCIEGNIQLNIGRTYFSFINMYKANCQSNYKFLNIYNIIKKHNKVYNYIANYFNLWHGKVIEEFRYDEYHKNDLSNNFNDLITLTYDEMLQAKRSNDKHIYNMYKDFIKIISSIIINNEEHKLLIDKI